MRVGQPAEVEADIYPGYIYQAHVDSISAGTGSAFALLPPENATGNWVKVVQRVPVKIVLNNPEPPDKPLRVGLSVEVTIDTTDTRGPLLSSTLQREFRKQRKYSGDAATGAARQPLADIPRLSLFAAGAGSIAAKSSPA